jgi:hypothetical protein
MAALEGAPEQQDMNKDYDQDDTDPVSRILGMKNSMLVKQTAKGCLQECCGCEAKNEFTLSAMDWGYVDGGFLKEGTTDKPNELYAIEESNCCLRICCQDGRPLEMSVHQGGNKDGHRLFKMTKPMGCPVWVTCHSDNGDVDIPCCCFLPNMSNAFGDGKEFSNSRYTCDGCLYVPKFMYQENGVDVYKVRPETCCCGCCISCECGGKHRCVGIPFYFWDPQTGEKIRGNVEGQEPQITKVWSGMAKECCTTADTFAVFFPQNISAKRKAALLGMTFLIDFVWFEGREG